MSVKLSRGGPRRPAECRLEMIADDWDRVEEQLGAVWEPFASLLRDEHERHRTAPDWDTLYCSVTLQSGKVILGPRSSKQPHRIGLAYARIHIPLLSDCYDALPDPTDDDKAFELRYAKLLNRAFRAIKASTHLVPARQAISRLREWNDFALVGQDGGEIESTTMLTPRRGR